jgi:hypothetical protein
VTFWLVIGAANGFAVIFWYLFERHHRALARRMKQRLAKARHGRDAISASGILSRRG